MPQSPEFPLPPDVLTDGLKLFTTEEALHDWIQKPALWAGGRTPSESIANGQEADVVGALKGLGHGNFL